MLPTIFENQISRFSIDETPKTRDNSVFSYDNSVFSCIDMDVSIYEYQEPNGSYDGCFILIVVFITLVAVVATAGLFLLALK